MALVTSIQPLADLAEWDMLASSGHGGTVFHERWFLRRAGVERVLCVRDGDALVCGLPLFTARGGRASNQSTRSVPYGGPMFARCARGAREAMLRRRTAMAALVQALQSSFTRISFACAPDLHDLVPWIRAGFFPEVRYTYVLDVAAGDRERFASQMSTLRRRELMRTDRAGVHVVRDEALRHFDVGRAVRWSAEAGGAERTRSVMADGIARGQGCALVAMIGGRAVAGLFAIWDRARLYTTHSYYEESAGRLGVSTRLYLEAMTLAAGMPGIRQLDFEGSVLDGVERYYQSFGGCQSVYFGLHWASDPGELALPELYRYR